MATRTGRFLLSRRIIEKLFRTPVTRSFMENSDIARQLSTFRKTIDNIDAALIYLLAERFRCTDEVGLLKARYQLPAVDEAREQQQYQRLAALAQEAELDTAIVQRLMQLVIGEVVERHRQIAARHAPAPANN